MKKFGYILLLVLLAAACGPRKIPRADMENIMADILIQDQQIKIERNLSRVADTSLVYEGVFESYGYNTDDFLYSVEYYLGDPSRMEKIMGTVAGRLEKETKVAAEQVRLEDWRGKLLRIYNLKVDTTRRPHPRMRLVDTLHVRFDNDKVYLHTVDSISFKDLDTLLFPPVDTL